MTFKVTRKDNGAEVKRGDVVTSATTENEYRFIRATNPKRILINPLNYKDNGSDVVVGGTEVLAKYFGVTVEIV